MLTDDRVPDLTRDELDRYPVGVITLDRSARILHYNRAESALSRRKTHEVVGRRFFGDVAPCTAVKEFEGRFLEFARGDGDAAERFDFAFAFPWGRQDVAITLIRRACRDEITLVVRVRSGPRRTGALHAAAGSREVAVPEVFAPTQTLVGQWVEEPGRTWWSPDVTTLFGLPSDALPAPGALVAYVHPDDRDHVRHVRASPLDRPVTFAYRILARDGHVRKVVEHVASLDGDGGRRTFGTIVDVTERERTEQRLWRSAHHDSLTGLPNRKLLLERLHAALDGDDVTLLFLDLDRFKQVNDSAGHAVGDQVLRMVASRLAAAVERDDVVARLNGDEFVVMLTGEGASGRAQDVADALLDTVAQPYVIDDEQFFVTVSIGIASAPHDARDAEGLINAADLAMYHSKERGANAFLRYDERIGGAASRQATLENELRRAVDDDAFVLYLQPVVDAAGERTAKAEALVRWRHPQRGIVAPAEFIPLAERTGLIVQLGSWVIDAACAQIRAWDELGLPPLVVAVNVSPLQFKDRRFPAVVRDALERHGIAPERLELELTESLAQRFDETMESLLDLKLLGVRLSIDDFGTGYSALAYLKYFPIDTLKLDRAFVSGIGAHPLDAAIAATIARLAADLRLSCVAEGVETVTQRDRLREIGVTHLQGYLFAPPLPPQAFVERLTAEALPAT